MISKFWEFANSLFGSRKVLYDFKTLGFKKIEFWLDYRGEEKVNLIYFWTQGSMKFINTSNCFLHLSQKNLVRISFWKREKPEFFVFEFLNSQQHELPFLHI